MRYLLKTFGCKANLSDSQMIEAELQKRGWQAATRDEDAALCIVNSCTVTDQADRQTRKMASRLARENPEAKVVVTGCAAEVDPERLAQSKGIHYVIGNRDKPGLVTQVLSLLGTAPESNSEHEGKVIGGAQSYTQFLSRHPTEREWPTPEAAFMLPPHNLRGETGRTRTFLKIQEGCNSFCTYCIIPYARGPSRSLSSDEVIAQIRDLVSQGTREVILTGTNIGDYGTDWDSTLAPGDGFARLAQKILSETELERLRVSSLDPTEITPALTKLMAREPRFCPHFHVSLQSPHSKILRLMKRRYGFEQVQEALKRIQNLPAPVGGPFVGMDLIAGFPGETTEEFQWTVEALMDLPWSRIHVFPYSERAGTPATRLPASVTPMDRQRRTQIIAKLSLDRLTQHYRNAVDECRRKNEPLTDILLESKTRGPGEENGKTWMGGYTSNYLRVLIKGSERMRENTVVSAMPEEIYVDSVAGDVAIIAREWASELPRHSSG